jgi:signal transduction histidine kinase
MHPKKQESPGSSNTGLEKELARITRDLEFKNRELEIEAALEKVRIVALAMKQRDDMLDICRIISQQLELLGITDIRNVQTAIIYPEKGIYINYEYYSLYNKTFITEVDYSHPIQAEFVAQMLKEGASMVLKLEGEELREWFEYQKTTNQFSDPHLAEALSLNYYWFSIGPVALGISLYAQLSEDGLKLFKRFLDVFKLAYRRYKDIELALTQAREAQIELALERVRARTMAMQHSSELKDAASILFQQVELLGVSTWTSGFQLWDDDRKAVTVWTCTAGVVQQAFRLPATDDRDTFMMHVINAEHNSEALYVEELNGEVLKNHYSYMAGLPGLEDNFASLSDAGIALPLSQVNHAAFFTYGYLLFITYHPMPEAHDIFKRFAKVFDQTYTRFLDLKKVESQAREGQIELALERVRARTMAMQHSDELAETAYILFQQFRELGENPDQATIGIINEAEGVIEYWVTIHGGQTNRVFKFPIDERNVTNKIYKAWKAHDKSLVIDLSAKALHDFSKFRENMGGAAHNPDEKRRIINVAFFSKGLINVQSTVERSLESLQLLERFAIVFESTYTRFLDLKQAEEQTREARIQLALERVRAKTMAMQHSNELLETSQVVFQQLRDLGETADQIGISIVKEDEGVFDLFATLYGTQMVRVFQPKIDDHFVMGRVYKNWKAHKKSFVVELGGEELRRYNILRNQLGGQNYYDENIGPGDRWVVSCASFSRGILSFSSSTEPTSEAAQLLERFAKVFEQTYTRFLDLQKAEAQARESQIQLALERVRARTMAMQHSEELAEAALLLFEQVQGLSLKTGSCGYNIWDKDKKSTTVWVSSQDGSLQPPFKMPHAGNVTYRHIHAAMQKGDDFFTEEVGGKALKKHFDYLLTVPGIRDVIQKLIDDDFTFPKAMDFNTAFFAQGYLSFHTHEPCPEFYDIFTRFAKVFEQTYTRFLDLKQAEAQARESQIQLGLERVRAKSMAMQTSEELNELIGTVFGELTKLDFILTRCLIMIFDPETNSSRWWMANSEAPSAPMNYLVQYHKNPAYAAYLKAWKAQDLKWRYALKGKVKKDWDDFLFVETELSLLPDFVIAGMKAPEQVLLSASFNNFGCLTLVSLEPLSDEHSDIMLRFAKVFAMSYTRFNDLKQAEAQARESQIQLGLERVRAAAMAMHNSNDVGNATALVFSEFYKLGITTIRCGVCIIDGPEQRMEVWSANSSLDGIVNMGAGKLDMKAHPLWLYLLDAWRQEKSSFSYELAGKELTDYYNAIKNAENYHPPESGKPGEFFEINQYCNCYLFNEGCLFTFTEAPFSPEANQVLERFAAVFGLTYRRYLDLTKAEAQAREAKIEAALERVRSRTMAMQKSVELREVIQLIYEQLQQLNFNVEVANFAMNYKESDDLNLWLAGPGQLYPTKMYIPYFNHLIFDHFIEAKEKGLDFYTLRCTFEEKNSFFNHFFKNSPEVPKERKEIIYSSPGYAQSSVLIKNIILSIANYAAIPYSETENAVLRRFANVFEQTYTRFNDLKQAEAQAKEAKIEAGLERVRAKAMAMHSSEDLAGTISVFYHELSLLSVTPRRCGLGLMDKETRYAEISTMNTIEQGESIEVIGELNMTGHPVLDGIYDNWLLQKEYHPVLKGNEIKEYYQMVRPQISYPDYPNDIVQYGYFFFFRDGGSFTWTETELPEDELQIYRRFNSVLSLTYRRYKDIKEAEAQAREAQIELGLERVRARTMAMQKSDELQEIIKVVYKQLVHLNISVEHAGFIMDYNTRDDMHIWLADKHYAPTEITVPYFDSPHWNGFNEAKQKGSNFFAIYSGFEEKNQFYQDLFKLIPGVTEETKEYYFSCPGLAISTVLLEDVGLYIENFAGIPYSDDENSTLMRFGKVFQQSYTRFLDLQKAEAQARKAQIEAALERVRSRTMAMRHSDELQGAGLLLFQQAEALGVNAFACGFNIWDDDRKFATGWMGSVQGLLQPFKTDSSKDIYVPIYEAAQRGDAFFVREQAGEELKVHYEYLATIPIFRDIFMVNLAKMGFAIPSYQIIHCAFFAQGYLMFISYEPCPEAYDIFKRFAKVFEQTYTRFLDLQKAEEQAREAKIEAALEKVRAKAMSMHQSQDINNAVLAVFEELEKLDLDILRCGIGIINKEKKVGDVWTTAKMDGKSSIQISGKEPMWIHPLLEGTFDAWLKQTDFLYELDGDDLVAYYKAVAGTTFTLPESHSLTSESHSVKQYYYTPTFKTGNLYAFKDEPFPEDAKNIMKRFAAVLNLTFSRFLDLQKAEAQVREAQIEAALEKVRSRSLAMHKSDELQEVVTIVFEKLHDLDIVMNEEATSIVIFTEGTKDLILWNAIPDQLYSKSFHIPYYDTAVISSLLDAKSNGADFFERNYTPEEKDHFWKWAFEHSDYKNIPAARKAHILEREYFACSVAYTKNSAILVSSYDGKLLSEKEGEILKRFARVFEQAYVRFLDLQKAEEQAKEARIEASLERVRSKAMAMRNSNDLLTAANTVFTELQNLGINQIRSGVGLIAKDFHKAKVYSATSSQNAIDLSLMGEVTLYGHPVFEQQYQSWLNRENYFVALEGKELASYYKILSAGLNADLGVTVKKNQKEYGHWFMFSEGFLYAWSDKEYTDAEIRILERFKNVMELTIRRYIELQKSETQAREAIRQASLDRVRAEIASMRTVTDLEKITPLIWNELTTLGVPFIRCGVFIMDETLQQIHTYLSTPDGKAIAAFQLPFNSDNGNGVSQAALFGWRQKHAVAIHWSKEEFNTFSHTLVERGEIASEESYLTERPPSGLDLHFFPFLQGMLYAGNIAPLCDDDKGLVQSLADAFSTAYARYEDFNKLEIAKQQVENTLTDLKAAQTRLIQSEKMASLGELTAGIAHEIQNPLNFVNNFSEVNQEMIDELEEELNAGNITEALAITADIKQNEQKINHHGKRADGIVKGMLQHSSSGGGEKVLTNINSVAEEYMRLSYHGLRAKDKSFNAEMLMNFDPELPRVEAVGQDIGRVFLNLFNNAFYAVNQKKKTAGNDYTPEVSVTTLTENGQVIIKVKDNGVGMPDHVKEKIMQPFFTTKPTGEGTGLGLSLTYDMVVKGHGGSIQVTSVEGEGSEFTISLPIN